MSEETGEILGGLLEC